jgi:phosphoglycolate phosphatase-like HAD superfamily hydrolase
MKTVIFDWDGVVVDSIPYKYGPVWKEVFPDEPEKQQAVWDFLKTPEGRSLNRYGLIRRALVAGGERELETLDDKALKTHPRIQECTERYAKAVKEHVPSMAVPEAVAAVRELHRRGHPLYVLSGGGTDEDLKDVAMRIGIESCFKGFFGFGSPQMPLISLDKNANFKRIAALERTNDPEHYVIVGDGDSDYRLARDVGCAFIAIATEYNGWANDPEMAKLCVPLTDLPSAIG